MRSNNCLWIGIERYELSSTYIAGALAARSNVSMEENPHQRSKWLFDDWAAGHTHETAGLHIVDKVDVITARRVGRLFKVVR